ncbi:hypothetical protein SAMN05444680_12443 [Variovorax sp. YR216]|nr:hypothetical protein SAMN05444680_12443 [Variovorax sp. YR216]
MSWKVASGSIVCVLLGACGTTSGRPPVQQSQDPSRFTYTRLFCSQDNESHFETVTTDLGKVDVAPPAPPFFTKANPASRIAFAGFDRAWGVQDLQGRTFHPAPSAQFVVYLQGTMAITVTDGETRRFGPGDVLRVEDTAPCKGHISVVGDKPAFTAISR